MGQINSTNLPQYVPDAQPAKAKLKTNSEAGNATAATSTSEPPQDDLQLTKLSAVLSGLKKGATAMRSQATQLMTKVRSGTYEVDPLQVSRSIVGDALALRP